MDGWQLVLLSPVLLATFCGEPALRKERAKLEAVNDYEALGK
jgi:hypothetical protein